MWYVHDRAVATRQPTYTHIVRSSQPQQALNCSHKNGKPYLLTWKKKGVSWVTLFSFGWLLMNFSTPQRTLMNLRLLPLFWILLWPGKDSHSVSYMPSCSRLFEAKTTSFYLIFIDFVSFLLLFDFYYFDFLSRFRVMPVRFRVVPAGSGKVPGGSGRFRLGSGWVPGDSRWFR